MKRPGILSSSSLSTSIKPEGETNISPTKDKKSDIIQVGRLIEIVSIYRDTLKLGLSISIWNSWSLELIYSYKFKPEIQENFD